MGVFSGYSGYSRRSVSKRAVGWGYIVGFIIALVLLVVLLFVVSKSHGQMLSVMDMFRDF